ncbi:MAG: hypothetical protein IJF28_04430 [Firmicutes bacterium]|nr:hypothetical protein [Bacillota bacterium]
MIKNLIAFHGADRKVGVTMIAQSVAECIANYLKTEDVLLVTLNGRQNAQYLREEASPIDNYRAKLESGIMVSKSEIDRVKNMNNLYVISGVKKETEERLYHPETAKKLLLDASSQFSIIIADCGSELDNGLAIGGLMSAEKKFMVLSQNEATLRRYENMKKYYEGLTLDFDSLIINKYSERDPYSLGYLRKRLSCEPEKLYPVALASLGRQAEMEYRTIMNLNEEVFVKDIEKLSFSIIDFAGLGHKKDKRKPRWKGFI